MKHVDNQFVVNYLDGHEESLEFLVKKYLKPIYSFVFRYVGNAQEAEDITQEVFIKVWKNLDKFNQQKSFKTWLFAIAKNTAFDHLKKKKTIPFSKFENEIGRNIITETLIDPSPLPQELLERADVAQVLSLSMSRLSPKYRMVLFLRYNDHFTFREIATSLEESLNTVKSRHRRALIQLKKFLTET